MIQVESRIGANIICPVNLGRFGPLPHCAFAGSTGTQRFGLLNWVNRHLVRRIDPPRQSYFAT